MRLKTTEFICFIFVMLVYLLGINSADTTSQSQKTGYVCTAADSPCPENYVHTENPKFCLRHTYIQLPWEEARHFCQRDNAELVVLKTHDRREHFKRYFKYLVVSEKFWFISAGRLQSKPDDRNVLIQWNKGVSSKSESKATNCDIVSIKYRRTFKKSCETAKHAFICEINLLDSNLQQQYKSLRDIIKSCPDGGRSRHYKVDTCEKVEDGVKIGRVARDKSCERGWTFKTIDKSVCMHVFTEPVTWTQAVNKCHKNNATLLTIENRDKLNIVLSMYHVWTGLNDRTNSGNAKWLDTPYVKWKTLQKREIVKTRDCSYFRHDGSLLPSPCTNFLPFVCQKESLDGPSDVKMEVKYFRRLHNITFLNEPVEVKCTALGTQIGNIMWSTYNMDQENELTYLQDLKITHEHELVQLKTGTCRNQSISTARFRLSKTFRSHISCFSYMAPGAKQCFPPVVNLQFCNAASVVLLVDEHVSKPPVLNLTYNGYPGPIEPGEILTASCYVYIGFNGAVFWAMYDKYNDYAQDPFKDEKPIITTHLTRNSDTGDHGETVFQLKMQTYMSGLSLACFSYNAVVLLGPNPKCYDTDMYCVQTQKILVTKRSQFYQAHNQSRFAWHLLFMFLGFFACALLIQQYGQAEKTGELEKIFPDPVVQAQFKTIKHKTER